MAAQAVTAALHLTTDVPWATGPHAERGPVRRSGRRGWLTAPTRVSPAPTTKHEHRYEDDQYRFHGHRASPPATAIQRVTTFSNLVTVVRFAYWTFVSSACARQSARRG
jgi:hypothetical protein